MSPSRAPLHVVGVALGIEGNKVGVNDIASDPEAELQRVQA